jgi:hypothetical protein
MGSTTPRMRGLTAAGADGGGNGSGGASASGTQVGVGQEGVPMGKGLQVCLVRRLTCRSLTLGVPHLVRHLFVSQQLWARRNS